MSVKSDQALEALVQSLLQALKDFESGKSALLWCADEHPIDDSLWSLLQSNSRIQSAKFLTNRLDQYRIAQAKGLDAEFSDFVFPESAIFREKGACIFIRVPKERALVHYLINQAFTALPETGKLCLFGYKGEGIKTHITRAASVFGGKAEISKGKNQLFSATLTKFTSEAVLLDDQNYATHSEIALPLTVAGRQIVSGFWSKPGTYGWNKIDQGSQFLCEVLVTHFENFSGKTILDLGCGYGYLSLFSKYFQAEKIISTDNCASALSATAKNMYQSNSVVVASDAGDLVEEPLDLILCNPPFHQGFSMNNDLHHKFLLNAQRLLQLSACAKESAKKAEAWFVVNQFLSLDTHCKKLGLNLLEVRRNSSFKVVKITL